MIKGFEEQTEQLTYQEKAEVMPIIIKGLSVKIGKNNSVTNKEIVAGLRAWDIKTTEPRVRKIINHIRLNGIISNLIATSAGYYVAENTKEVKDYIESLRGRENAIRTVRMAMEKQMEIKQPSLF